MVIKFILTSFPFNNYEQSHDHHLHSQNPTRGSDNRVYQLKRSVLPFGLQQLEAPFLLVKIKRLQATDIYQARMAASINKGYWIHVFSSPTSLSFTGNLQGVFIKTISCSNRLLLIWSSRNSVFTESSSFRWIITVQLNHHLSFKECWATNMDMVPFYPHYKHLKEVRHGRSKGWNPGLSS